MLVRGEGKCYTFLKGQAFSLVAFWEAADEEKGKDDKVYINSFGFGYCNNVPIYPLA